MIETKDMAVTFFRCLRGMGIEYVCFDRYGKLGNIGDCVNCPNECLGTLAPYWVDDAEAPMFFADDYDLDE